MNVQLINRLKNLQLYKKRHSNSVLLWREIYPLAMPIFIENLSVILMGIFSTFLVSWIGKAQMAAVGLAESFNMIIMSFFMAVALGTSVVVAFSLGRHNRKKAVFAARQSITLLVLVSVLLFGFVEFSGYWIVDIIAGKADPEVKNLTLTFLRLTVLGYPALAFILVGCGALRGAGNTKLPMYLNIIMNILNISISYVLIYGIGSWQGFGFIGAGIGLTTSRYCGMFFILLVLTIKPSRALFIPLRSYFHSFNARILVDILSIGIPASVESVMFNVGKLLTQTFVAGMGTSTIAANFIAFSIAGLLNLPGGTLGATSTIIVGKRLGMGQIYQPTRQLKFIFQFTNILLCLIAFVTMPFAGLLSSLYTNDPEVIEISKHLLWLNALFTPFWASSFVLPYGFKGAKDASYTMWVAIGSMWMCRIVVGYLFGVYLGFGVIGVWFGMFLDWIIRSIFFYYRLVSGKWLWRHQEHN
ncbi:MULTISPECIES: EmmdR/YeeO family multidrug/toxin efflux MATE transporter [unclassified Gilliamella]|uniref:EmmdR/YeeO family multidrug/toxin efflux MATE transporter n=1 Tax=unclassified Gilliamella TaxID=2685620 RepID=UPI00226AF7CA|nr:MULTISPECIES: EmmdR/YeeO family multidrug/toxin efflux MATE transporter [unclassified Gilliamella]MCX8642938.1 EmmdR/YeeO family multidrug/toxin efflux MATE transporter [Gilliamella sp. B3835]MCX8708290.1 EmmdR/YeeO family multidrug/toxin efflux MATE transporter [Gilliamella sp. B3783]MCX8709917.1 EmmdR/YeeO family multidrug/toxin efflux MATE transporter [Gilliamella sp. B3780]MCX8714230.1 EmmdR/YeeO family multidrug/toxin efflux MATE transporter [Gilliamella sp. B3781]MCX8717525.1 EmmdR/Ye